MGKNKNSRIKNYAFPTALPKGGARVGTGGDAVKNLTNYISPVQFARLKHDVKMWRESISEAESAWYPHRVRQQRMYIDTILNGHTHSVMERRKDLTMLRDFEIVDKAGTPSEVLTQLLTDKEWFNLFLGYSLDADFFGYSLISLGDAIDDEFPNISIVRRWNVSPDRLNVASMTYSLSGANFLEEPYKDWHVWVPTPTETGQSTCGYGLFYKIGIYEILLRNILGYNADFVELYAQPYRVGKTTKTNDDERAELERALQMMGSNGYAVIDPTDEIEFLEAALAGTGWQSYDNFEQRMHKAISKIVLGHADAMDSIPGKLGSGQNDHDPIQMALRDKQTKDGRRITALVNKQLIPRMRNIGFNIPDGFSFRFKNDKELREIRVQEDTNNLATATIAQTMKNAGLQMAPEYFEERTGIPTEKIELPEPVAGDPNADKKKKPFNNRIQNKLDEIYNG